MKFYYCLMQNDPIDNQISCYRMLRCEEVDQNDKEKLDTLSQEYQHLYTTKPGMTIMFFHLPTKDVKMFMPPGLPEGVFYYDFLKNDQASEPEGSTWEAWQKQVQRSREATRTFDEKWEEWKPGDKIVWTDNYFGPIFLITKINHDTGYVWWDAPGDAPEQMTRATNLYRVTIHDAEE